MIATLALLLAAQDIQASTPPDVQDTVAADEPAQGEIVVTAQRRSQRLQEVPIAISVLDQKTITDTGTYNVDRVKQLQPSLNFFSSNPRNSAINIRGLGAPFGLTNDGIEQGVGLYIDQVYYSRPAAASFDFIDIDQIEVLRGPQGTLYGKNTTAGALNITTRKPSFRQEGRAEISIGNLGFVQAKASVSGPLVADRLAVRLAVTGTSRNGTLTNVRSGVDVNEQNNIGARASLLWRATPDLDITLSGDFNRQDPECCAQVAVRVAPTLRAANRRFAGLAAAFNYSLPSTNPFDRLVDNDSDLQARQNFGGASLLAEWYVGPGTVTSVTAWRFWDWFPQNDRDFIGLPITTVSANQSKQRQLTQEVRYASDNEGPLNYVVGVFGYRQVIDTAALQEQGAAASLWLLGPTNGSNPALLDGLRQATAIHFENNSVAAFGKLTWKITDRLTIQPGLRINYDSKSTDYDAVVIGGLANPTPAQQALKDGVLASQRYVADVSQTNLSGDINLSWEVADDINAYATYARAFKSVGINLSGIPADAAGVPILAAAEVRPEKVDHFELGLKTQLFDRRLTANVSAFWTDIFDYQATVTNGQLGVLRGYLANAEHVRARGVELELNARVGNRLSLYASGTFNDARYVRFVDAPPPIELSGGAIQNVDISGQRLAGVSKWSASYGGEYALPLGGSNGSEAYFGLDGSYRSSFSSNATPSAFTNVDGYTVINLRAGWRSDDGWNIFGWLRNAFDEEYFDFLSTQPGNSGLIVGQPADPRTYGFTIARKF